MKEQLYIIVNGKRRELDLCNPSGITLQYKSNLFNDLSKIVCSHSYSFKLPFSQNNRRIFENIDDIRMNNSFVGKKIDCEYLQDGVSLFRVGNLYVSEVSDSYQCVMTWNVFPALAEMKDEDLSINQLDKDKRLGQTTMYVKNKTPNIEYTFSTDDVAIPATYSGGVDYFIPTRVNNDDATAYYRYLTETIDRDIEKGTKEYIEDERRKTILATPLPVVPIRGIISKICSRYSMSLGIGGEVWHRADMIGNNHTDQASTPLMDIINAGVIPMTSAYTTDLEKSAKIILNTNGAKPVSSQIFASGTKALHFPLSMVHQSDSTYTLLSYENGVDITLFKPLNGNVEVELNGYIKILNRSNIGDCKLQIRQRGNEARTMDDEQVTEIDKIETEDGKTVTFEFRKELGYSNISAICNNSFGFALDRSLYDEAVSIDAYVEITAKRPQGEMNQHIQVYRSLPDIKCIEFIKSVLYAVGGCLSVDNQGNTKTIYYDDLETNKYRAYDWTDRIVADGGAPDSISFAMSDFKQKNYLLMKNESADNKDEEEDKDKFSSPMFSINCESQILDDKATIFQFPYNGAYLQDSKYKSASTGKTLKRWQYDMLADKTISASDCDPMIGVLRLIKLKNETSTADAYAVGMVAWDSSALENNESYQYLASILDRPKVIKDKFVIDGLELRDMDWSIPVYIGRYNAYFAIIGIERNSDGVCTCELIKLPN